MANELIEIRPQPGPQEMFLSTPADVAIYGGAAGGGKTFALLMEPLRHMVNSKFGAVIFRRNATQITNEGGLWDSAIGLYPYLGAIPRMSYPLSMVFPSSARVSFKHLQMEKSVLGYQGAQIPLICYDELTHFTMMQFFYMLSRNRSVCGIRPYVRATTNPDPDSWVAEFIAWWIDQNTGYPIPERSGVIRYFIRIDGDIVWADTAEQLMHKYHVERLDIKSFTFIASSIFDNKILLEKDPAYLGNLKAMSTVDKERLLYGNWKIRPSAGLYFKAAKIRVVKSVPDKIVAIARSWDLAATEATRLNPSPDKTAGVMIARLKNGMFIILHAVRAAENSAAVRSLVKSTALADRVEYQCNTITIPQDPGQAGKDQAGSYVQLLSGFSIKTRPVSGQKVKRAEPFSAQCLQGNVLILEGAWNKEYLDEMEGFPDGAHDDFVDASSDAFNEVANFSDWGGLIS